MTATPTSKTCSATPIGISDGSTKRSGTTGQALRLNPRHRGAHEYIGEAYLMVDDVPKAEEHLAALKRICLIACEEYEDLEKAIADYRARHGP